MVFCIFDVLLEIGAGSADPPPCVASIMAPPFCIMISLFVSGTDSIGGGCFRTWLFVSGTDPIGGGCFRTWLVVSRTVPGGCWTTQ